MRKKILLIGLILGIIGLVFLSGCMHVASLVITPTSAIVEEGGTVAFTAANSAGSPVSVTWSVSSGPGTISTAGVYTAPTTVTTHTNATITATATQVGYVGITKSTTVTITLPPSSEANLIDAVGDASASSGTVYDVKGITTSVTSTALVVNIEFTAVPTLPAASTTAAGTHLAGFVCFDTDEQFITGWSSPNSLLCPSCPTPGFSAIGLDYFVDLFSRNASGYYPIRSTASSSTPTGWATPSLTGSTLTLTIPLAALGGDDGITGMSALLGNGSEPSDCVPDSVGAIVTGKAVVLTFSGSDWLGFLNTEYGISWGTSIVVTETAYPGSVQSGNTVTFVVNVENNGTNPVTLNSLTHEFASTGTANMTLQTPSCTLLPYTIPVGESYECDFNAVVTGDTEATVTDEVTAVVDDYYGRAVTTGTLGSATVIIISSP